MEIVRGAGVIRWGASDGHSPYIGENGNWWQWNETVGDFVDTGVRAKGVDGMPGQVPIQKEWKEGDTHRNDTNIVDFIYVRAALSADRKWYKLNDNYVTRTVPAGETEPSAATITEYYEEIPWLSALAVNVLIAEEANLANFIFKDGKLISVRGTVDGVAADYTGQENFIPNIVLDGRTGIVSIVGRFSTGDAGNTIVLDPTKNEIQLINENGATVSQIGFEETFIGETKYYFPYINQSSPEAHNSKSSKLTPTKLHFYSSVGGGYDTEILLDVLSQLVRLRYVDGYGNDNYIKVNLNGSLNKLDIEIAGLPKTNYGTVPGFLVLNNGYLEIDERLGLSCRVRTIGATSTLTDEDEVVVAVTSGITLTMPTATLGRRLKIKNRTSATITLISSQQFFSSGSTSAIIMASGDSVELVFDGIYWCVM